MNSNTNFTVNNLFGYAKGQLVGRYGSAIAAVLCIGLVNVFVSSLTNFNTTGTGYIINIVIAIIIDILMGALFYGEAYFYLKLARGDESVKVSDIFYGLSHNLDKAVCLEIPFTIMSSLFVIPSLLIHFGFITIPMEYNNLYIAGITLLDVGSGIILRLWLGLSYYILVDEPDLSVGEVFRKSMNLMKGNKLKYLGIWLMSIPLTLLGYFACCVGAFVVSAYIKTAFANFYLLSKGETPWTIDDVKENHFDTYA